jgi:hypothetical protein
MIFCRSTALPSPNSAFILSVMGFPVRHEFVRRHHTFFKKRCLSPIVCVSTCVARVRLRVTRGMIRRDGHAQVR